MWLTTCDKVFTSEIISPKVVPAVQIGRHVAQAMVQISGVTGICPYYSCGVPLQLFHHLSTDCDNVITVCTVLPEIHHT